MPGITVPEYEFSGSRRISGRGNGQKSVCFCNSQENHYGDSGDLSFEQAASFVWNSLCAVCDRSNLGGCGCDNDQKNVQGKVTVKQK